MAPDIQKAFHEAIKKNDVETARRMIAAGADVNAAYDEYENRSLLDASYQGNLDLVKMLVEAGADVNLSDGCGVVPLVRAIVSWHETDEVVKYLIECGANVNACEGESWTPLEAAVHENASDIVKMLLDAGANPYVIDSDFGDSLLMQAAEDGNPKCVKLILGLGVDINHRNHDGETALLYAVNRRLPHIVLDLLRAGANPNIKDNAGTSPLAFALTYKNYECAEILLRFRALLESSNEYYSEEILENINDYTLFYNMKDNGFALRTDDEAVILYAKHACTYLLRKALEAGANPNATDQTGKSALAWALEHPRYLQGCAVRLIRHGATFTPELLIYAVRNRMRELVAALLNTGADVNVQDERGNTALHYAARKNTEFFIRDLITAGADIEIRNKAGYTPLMLTIRFRCFRAASALLGHGADRTVRGGKHNERIHAMCQRYHCRIDHNSLINVPFTGKEPLNKTN